MDNRIYMANDVIDFLTPQASALFEVLNNYAYRCVLEEIWEQRAHDIEERLRIRLPWIALIDALTNQSCNRLSALFDSYRNGAFKKKEGWNVHFHRLLDYPKILSSSKYLEPLAQLPDKEKQAEKLKKILLIFAEVNVTEFDEEMRRIRIYRDKEVSHLDIYTEDEFNDPEKKRYYPRLLPLTKVAFSLIKIVQDLRYSFGNGFYSISQESKFDDYINERKKDFKDSLAFFLKQKLE